MEAIGKTWEKSLTDEGDAQKSGDGGTDEFLSRGGDWPGCKKLWRRKGKVHWRIYKMTPPQESGFRIDEPFTLQRHGALLRQLFKGNNCG